MEIIAIEKMTKANGWQFYEDCLDMNFYAERLRPTSIVDAARHRAATTG